MKVRRKTTVHEAIEYTEDVKDAMNAALRTDEGTNQERDQLKNIVNSDNEFGGFIVAGFYYLSAKDFNALYEEVTSEELPTL